MEQQLEDQLAATNGPTGVMNHLIERAHRLYAFRPFANDPLQVLQLYHEDPMQDMYWKLNYYFIIYNEVGYGREYVPIPLTSINAILMVLSFVRDRALTYLQRHNRNNNH